LFYNEKIRKYIEKQQFPASQHYHMYGPMAILNWPSWSEEWRVICCYY